MVRGFKMFCQRGVRIFSTCFVCECGGRGQVQYLSFREKKKINKIITNPPPINK